MSVTPSSPVATCSAFQPGKVEAVGDAQPEIAIDHQRYSDDGNDERKRERREDDATLDLSDVV
jgi:hypothetical protein